MRNIRAAVRFVLFVLLTLGIYGIWFVARIFVPNKVYARQLAFGAWTRGFVKLSGMDVEIIGTPPRPPFFLVTNHLSYTDIAAIRYSVTGIFVAKAEVESWPLAGRICRDYGTIFINRQNRRDIPRAGRQIVKRLEDGEGVIIFPEGTSTKGETVLPFNSSFLEFAAYGQISVSYAAIMYRTPPGELSASETACWWTDITFFTHLWRLFKVRSYTAIINFGEEPVQNEDRKLLAQELRQRVTEKFVPVL